MKNNFLDDQQQIKDVRTVEDVARRALALGAVLERQDAELGLMRGDIEEGTDMRLHYGPDFVGGWLFLTGLITSLEPYEIKCISKLFGSWDFYNSPDYSLDFYMPFEEEYQRLRILLWALAFLPDIPGEESETPRSQFFEVGNPIYPFIQSARLRHPYELRTVLNYARSELLDCASQNPAVMRYLGSLGYRIPWQSRIKLMGDKLINQLDRRFLRLIKHRINTSPNYEREGGLSFSDALELYSTIAWILDDKRQWDCRQVS